MTGENYRRLTQAHGIRLWQVALCIGISEATLTRWLRVPLSGKKEQRLLNALKRLAQEKREEAEA